LFSPPPPPPPPDTIIIQVGALPHSPPDTIIIQVESQQERGRAMELRRALTEREGLLASTQAALQRTSDQLQQAVDDRGAKLRSAFEVHMYMYIYIYIHIIYIYILQPRISCSRLWTTEEPSCAQPSRWIYICISVHLSLSLTLRLSLSPPPPPPPPPSPPSPPPPPLSPLGLRFGYRANRH